MVRLAIDIIVKGKWFSVVQEQLYTVSYCIVSIPIYRHWVHLWASYKTNTGERTDLRKETFIPGNILVKMIDWRSISDIMQEKVSLMLATPQ